MRAKLASGAHIERTATATGQERRGNATDRTTRAASGYRLRTHGSAKGERGRDETTGRETVLRTLLSRIGRSTALATDYGQRKDSGWNPREG